MDDDTGLAALATGPAPSEAVSVGQQGKPGQWR